MFQSFNNIIQRKNNMSRDSLLYSFGILVIFLSDFPISKLILVTHYLEENRSFPNLFTFSPNWMLLYVVKHSICKQFRNSMIDLENSNHEKKTPYVLCSLKKKKCSKFITYHDMILHIKIL